MFAADNDLITGILLVLAGLLALLRQSLLEPDSPNYPKAPTWLRHCMFAFAVILTYTGLQSIWVALSARMGASDVSTGHVQLLAVSLCLYNGAMVGNLLRQRYPQDVWERLNRINERLFCNDKPFHRWLSK